MSMIEVAIPRFLVGKKFTPTAITIVAAELTVRNRTELITIEWNSVRKSSAKHADADTVNQISNKRMKMKFNGHFVLTIDSFGIEPYTK